MSIYLITGAAQGLGRSLSLALAKEDNQLILLDKDLKALNYLYDEINNTNELLAEPALYPMDLLGANIDHYQALTTTLEAEYGRLDGVFLNAATLPAFTPVEHFDYTQWYEVLHTNLNANFHLIQQTLPLLKQADKSVMVAVLDQNIEEHPAYYGAYGAAKAGLEQLMKTCAKENPETSVRFYNAKLEGFQSNTRSRQFPSENPATLPTSDAIAQQLLNVVLEGLTSESIEKL
ncbi:putative oxidoreductase YciK [Hydrogenovibrio crunogenus]|uniref:Putative oxidoreductase YciK n=1 Tax=Hydrogenovibrio crunogenus TaxID=39765 RepID=A0A4P7P0C1_9GAMM|nr:SDR family NAD(P)-dependent oxidoreductase [Hydrogenovibrio crunogenus]QBZ83215.1 putative oxidoreductase YciK [Hydrogenovibrio crunogenus]RUM93337.1 MAG: short-chain dehydrogenase [Thiomicrospira sp.]